MESLGGLSVSVAAGNDASVRQRNGVGDAKSTKRDPSNRNIENDRCDQAHDHDDELHDSCFVIQAFSNNGIRVNGGGYHVIRGNFIGTDTNGTMKVGNGMNGILIEDSGYNQIGMTPMTNTANRNIVSGNKLNGIALTTSSVPS